MIKNFDNLSSYHSLFKLVKIIYGREVHKVKLHNRKKFKLYHYKIFAFTASGAKSRSVKLNCLLAKCFKLDLRNLSYFLRFCHGYPIEQDESKFLTIAN